MNLYFRLLLLWLRSRRARRVSLWDEVRTPFRVVPTDLDPLMHMNNARYLALLDLGRTDLMFRSGFWDEVSKRGWYPVVTAQTISYKRSLTLWQRFELATRVLGVDERHVYMEQEFHRGGKVIARAVVQARFLRKQGGTVDPGELLAAAGGDPGHLTLPEWVRPWADAVRISHSQG
ncbi:thioesterase family protein [Microbacterium sp. Marseille-Q6965]|uniref:acyl-CoA thioesterase n=1 Tax=Microbacterium sp. Marseille-Q6965 TaxID=2965072 RepID=UPI0021B72EA4|nr:acyl-CoA thioesterase [Microbacterium sp. Marseille-Q6965]